jgi:hypothetical protein
MPKLSGNPKKASTLTILWWDGSAEQRETYPIPASSWQGILLWVSRFPTTPLTIEAN